MNEQLGSMELEFLINNPEILQQLRQAERSFQQTNTNIQRSMNQNASAFESYAKKAALAAASYFSLSAVKGFTAELVAVRGEFEQLNVAYSTILRSQEKGDALFKETVRTAATTPFNLTEVAQSTKQLLAYGTAANDITRTITMLGNVAAGVSAPLNDIVYLYGTLQTQGRAYAQDIRQFTGRGIPIIQELAKQFGVTEAQVSKLVEEGKVGFPEVQKAFESMTGSAGMFYNLMEKQSKTLTGQLANLQDAWAMMLNEIGEDNQSILSGGIEAAASLVKHYQDVLDILGLLVVAYGAYKAAVMLQTAVQIINEEVTLQQALAGRQLTAVQGLQAVSARALSGVQLTLNRIMQSGALLTALQTTAITAIIGSIYAWHKASEATEAVQNSINETRAEATKKLEEEKLKVTELIAVLKSNTSKYDEKAAAIKKLNDLNPEFLGGLTQQNVLTKEGTDLIRDYLSALDDKLQGEAAYAAKLKNLQQITDLKSRGIDAVDNAEAIGRSLKYFVNGQWMWSSKEVNKRIVADKIDELQKANEAIDKTFAEQLKQRATGVTSGAGETDAQKRARQFAADLAKPLENFDKLLKTAVGKADFERVKKALEDQSAELTATLGPDEKQIAQINKKVERVKDILNKYNPEKQAKSGTDALSAEQRRLDMLNRMYQLNEKYNARSLEDGSAKLEAIRLEYASLRADIDKYNANPKNTKKINTGSLDASQFAAQKNQADLNENKLIEEDLAKKKSLYEDYEQARQSFGETTAKALYADLLLSGTSYKDFLSRMLGSLAENNDLTEGALQERKKMVATAFDNEVHDTEGNFRELLAGLQSYQSKRAVLLENGAAKQKELLNKGYTEEAAAQRDKTEAELTELDLAQVEKLKAYRELFDGMAELSAEQAKKNVEFLRDYVAKSDLTTAAKKQILDKLRKAQQQIDTALPQGLRAIGNEFSGIADSVAKFDEGLGSALGTFAKLITSAANLKQGLNDLDVAQRTGNTLGQATAGLGIIGTLVSVFTSVTSAISKAQDKASAEFAEQFKYAQQIQLKAAEAVNKLLERQLELVKEIYGPERLTAYKKQLEDIAKATDEANNKLKGRFALTGNKQADEIISNFNNLPDAQRAQARTMQALYESLASFGAKAVTLTGKTAAELQALIDKGLLDSVTGSYAQALIELEAQAKEVRNLITAQVTGINFDGLLDKIRAVFDSGETSAKNFADAIETAIQGAFSNAFKLNEIEKRMQPFYDALYKAGLDGSFTNDEIKTLRDMRDKIAQELADRAKAYEQIIGPDTTGNKAAKTLEGSIKASLIEETGSIMAGKMTGIHLAVIKIAEHHEAYHGLMGAQLSEMRQQTLLQMQIAANTKKTAENTAGLSENTVTIRDTLKSIDKNTADTSGNILRAAGLV